MPLHQVQQVPFGELTIEYDDRVLRPRPWTVMQARWAADLLPALPDGDVLEVCCGAGQIGLLAASATDRHLVLVDASEVACGYARTNTARAVADGTRPEGSVEVRHGLLEDALDPHERFALVIADPPWVTSDETSKHPEDPLSAIDGGPDGLEVVRACLALIDHHLVPEGVALLQVGGADQVAAVAAHVEQHPELDLRVVDSRLADDGAVALLRRP